MKSIKVLILLFCGLICSVSARAQVPELVNNRQFRPDAKAAVDSIYNFNFDEADRVLSPWKEKYPHHPLWSLIEGMKFWWQVLSDLEDPSHDKQFVNMMKRAGYQAGKLLHEQSGHVDALIIQAIAYGYIGRQYSNREEWISSLNYARKAMDTYEYLQQLQPGMADLKLARGLKLYYSAYLPEAYPIVRTVSWFLPDGDKDKGLRLIKEAARKGIFARAEATYFLGNIYYNYEKNYAAAIPYFEKLTEQYPHNNYYARLLVKNYFQLHQYDKALRFIDITLQRWKKQQLPFHKVLQEELLTWKGRILEQRGHTEEALSLYRQAFQISSTLPNTKSRGFWTASGYLAADILYDQNKPGEARRYLEQIVDAREESNYRKWARNLLSRID